MNTIISNYKLLIHKYKKIEGDFSENGIHDKRVIIRKITPILEVFKVNPVEIKNGNKTFKLFGDLRDIQVQKLKLENMENTFLASEYIIFLKEKELKLIEKLIRFSQKKKLKFPSLKAKLKVEKSKVIGKSYKLLAKIKDKIRLQSVDNSEYIHKIRIEFKKFRYLVEVLSYLQPIEESRLERLKIYQDQLGLIQDYTVLIKGIARFYEKTKLEETEAVEVFKKEQNILIENFKSETDRFIRFCTELISYNTEVAGINFDTIVD